MRTGSIPKTSAISDSYPNWRPYVTHWIIDGLPDFDYPADVQQRAQIIWKRANSGDCLAAYWCSCLLQHPEAQVSAGHQLFADTLKKVMAQQQLASEVLIQQLMEADGGRCQGDLKKDECRFRG